MSPAPARLVPGRPTTTRRRLVPADVVRVAAGVSVVLGVVLFGPVGAALFALVLAATLIPRALRAPALVDVAYGAALLAAAWAGELGLYESISWLDLVLHLLSTGLVAVVADLALQRWGLVGDALRPRAAGVLRITSLGALAAVLWEIAEWSGHTYLDSTIYVGYDDTISDLAAGVLGSALAGLAVARVGGARPPEPGGRP